MRYSILRSVIAFVLTVGLAAVVHASAASGSSHTPTDPTGIIVKIRTEAANDASQTRGSVTLAAAAALDNVGARFNATSVQPLFGQSQVAGRSERLAGIMLIDIPNADDISDAIRAYAELDIVEYAEPDWPMTLFAEPNDSLYSLQWSLNNTGQAHYVVYRYVGDNNDVLDTMSGTADADIDALEVHDNPPVNTTAPVVAIIDTGVDPLHPDLQNQLWSNVSEVAGNGLDDDHNGFVDDVWGWDFSGEVFAPPSQLEDDNDPSDTYGHGTHVAGIVAAEDDNSVGIAGICNSARIMSVKVFPHAFTSVVAKGIIYAANNGADVVNLSLGSPFFSTLMSDAIEYARARGVVVIAATGNDGSQSMFYPAALATVIAVGASDSDDRVATFSTYGPHLDVCAPGMSILSLRAAMTDMYAEDGEPGVHIIDDIYYLADGTSMACPHAVGVAAFVRAVSPGLVPDSVQSILESSADDFTDPYGNGGNFPGWDQYSGHGRVNLFSALAIAPGLRATLEHPVNHQIISGEVALLGTADGPGFSEYRVEYGEGAIPATWTEIFTSNTPVTNDTLGTWTLPGGLEGVYGIRLRMGETHSSVVTVYVSPTPQAVILAPEQGDTLRGSADITGTAMAPDFSRYDLEYGAGATPSQWSIIQTGSAPVHDSTLGTWAHDTLSPGVYALRLTVYSPDSQVAAESIWFYLEPYLAPPRGWKTALNSDIQHSALVANHGDFDGDGDRSIVIGTHRGLCFYDTDGLTEAAPDPHLDTVGGCSTPVAVGDLDGDGADDVVAVTDSGWLVAAPSTEPIVYQRLHAPPVLDFLSGPGILSESLVPLVFLMDIDGDNRDEIHYCSGDRHDPDPWYVYNSNGSLRLSMPIATRGFLPTDLNGDGIMEFYMGGQDLFRADLDGLVDITVDLAPSAGDQVQVRSMYALDIDGDERLELVIWGTVNFAYWMWAFDENLNLKSGWPHEIGINAFLDATQPTFADLDRDGTVEYILTAHSLELGMLYVWRSDGTPFLGYSSTGLFASTPIPGILRHPVVANLDQDSTLEILASCGPDIFLSHEREFLYAWDADGTIEPGWPILTETLVSGSHDRENTNCIADLDQNGLIDVFRSTLSNNLIFTNLDNTQFDSTSEMVTFWRLNRRLNNSIDLPGHFEVTAVSPTQYQDWVPPNTRISIRFNRPLDLSTFTDSSFTVTGSFTGIRTGSLDFDMVGTRVTFTSVDTFFANEVVQVELTDQIGSVAGKALVSGFRTHFEIAERPPAGDVNCDGVFDLADVVLLGNHLDGLIGLTGTCDDNLGDVNDDGLVDDEDYNLLYNIVAGGP